MNTLSSLQKDFNIIIRKANETDLQDILALINSPEADNGTAMELRDANTVYQSILDDANYFQIVASTEEGIIAIVTLVIIMQMTHEGTTTAFITDLIISENVLEKQSEKIDSETIALDLMQYATNLAEEYGCYKIIFNNDYQQALIESSCRTLELEKGPASFNLPS